MAHHCGSASGAHATSREDVTGLEALQVGGADAHAHPMRALEVARRDSRTCACRRPFRNGKGSANAGRKDGERDGDEPASTHLDGERQQVPRISHWAILASRSWRWSSPVGGKLSDHWLSARETARRSDRAPAARAASEDRLRRASAQFLEVSPVGPCAHPGRSPTSSMGNTRFLQQPAEPRPRDRRDRPSRRSHTHRGGTPSRCDREQQTANR
jgi:hypothetical protein